MKKVMTETRLMFVWNLKITLRSPIWVIIGLIQPVLYLLLFAPLLDNLSNNGSFPQGGALNVFTPGLLIMMGIFSGAFVGIYLIESLHNGVLERLRVTPVSRTALLLGMLLRDVLVYMVQCAILVGAGIVMGLDPDPAGLLAMFALLGLVSLTIATVSYGLALALRDQDALVQMIQFFAVPLQLLSGILLPMTLAPRLLRNISDANPFSHAVEAARALINGDFADYNVWLAFVLFALLALLAFNWVTGSLKRAAA
jgi:ABC-2 type transport system permease protein